MLEFLKSILAHNSPAPPSRPRLNAVQWPAVIYAIGDVHGCYDALVNLQDLILADAAGVAGEKWIVMLGDYIDRGPRSADVIDLLRAAPPDGFKRICLAGNHEAMLLDYLANPRIDANWLRFGGLETLQSYGVDRDVFVHADRARQLQTMQNAIAVEHLDWLKGLPTLLAVPGVVFVHAGLRPGVPLANQADADLMWIREPFLSDAGVSNLMVVHGHTPGSEPVVKANRIDIDTAAFSTGILTAVRIDATRTFRFISTVGHQPD